MTKKRVTKKNAMVRNYYDITLSAKLGKKRLKTVILPSGNTVTTSTNIKAGDIIWYPGVEKSFVRTTLDYLKGWFK